MQQVLISCAIFAIVALGIIVAYLVPVLIQLKRTLAAAEQTVSDVQTLIPEFRQVGANLNRATERLNEPVEHLAHVTSQLDVVASKIIATTDKMAVPMMKVAGIIAGVKSGINYIRKRRENAAERGK